MKNVLLKRYLHWGNKKSDNLSLKIIGKGLNTSFFFFYHAPEYLLSGLIKHFREKYSLWFFFVIKFSFQIFCVFIIIFPKPNWSQINNV